MRILIIAGFLLILFFTISSLHAQNAGDAVQFAGGSYFSLSLSQDSFDSCTIELWVNPSENVDTIQLFYIGDLYTSGFGLYATRLAGAADEFAEIRLGTLIESVTGNQARLPLHAWTHLALTCAEGIWKFYKNGSLVGIGRRNSVDPSAHIILGKGLHGMLDEVRLWNRERTQEEIRSSLSQKLTGSEIGLRYYYTFDGENRIGDSVLINKAASSTPADTAHLIVLGQRPQFIVSSLPLYLSSVPKITLRSFPSHMQFYARGNNGYSTMQFDGIIEGQEFDSIILKKMRKDVTEGYWAIQTGNKINPSFHFTDSIHAEKSQYTYAIFGKNSAGERFLAEAADLVSGDAFYIAGQSNAHPAIGWYSNINPFYRTFGVQTTNLNFDDYDPADTSWGFGNGHGFGEIFGGPYLIGVWASHLGSHILDDDGIPTCFINAAAGGSTIEQNLPNDTLPADLSTVYGRGLYRSIKSGLEKKYRAIFWYQGEYNSIDGYYDNFHNLYNSWSRDFTDSSDNVLQKIYVFQIRPGCVPGERKALRELQRTLPDSLPHIEVMSTCGVSGHDDCHFDAFGYWHIADNIYRLVAKDLYGSHDTIDIFPPNIKKAFFADSEQDAIILQFSNVSKLLLTPDTVLAGIPRQLKNYFYLDSNAGVVRNILLHGDSLILEFIAGVHPKFVSYLPDFTYNEDGNVYEGPWIMNSRGVGALSFNNIPIQAYQVDTTAMEAPNRSVTIKDLHCTSNPVSVMLEISFTLTRTASVEFDLLDLLGRTVLSFDERNAQSGTNVAFCDLFSLSTGPYTLRMKAGGDMLTEKIIYRK